MNLLRLSWFNIKKYKGAAISIVVLISFCQLFLGLGVHNIFENMHLFEEKSQALEGIQNVYCIEENLYRDEYEILLKEDARVSKVVVQDSVLLWENVIKLNDGSDYMCNSVLINGGDENLLEKIILEENEVSLNAEHPIYAPLILKMHFGFELGDEFKILYRQQEYVFQIAGFYETTVFANGNMGAIKYIISEEDYEKISETYGETKILGYNTYDLQDIPSVDFDFTTKAKEVSKEGNQFQVIFSIDYLTIIGITTLFPVLLAYLLLLFAVIIFVTIFIIIRHRITNSIEEQMKNIGALQALGYTSRQIAGVHIIEYSLLAVVGTVLGSLVARLILPIVNQFSNSMFGLVSSSKANWLLDLLVMVVLVFSIMLVSFSKARKVKDLPPIIAFRKGINNHHFKRNYFALEKTKGNVHFRLVGKRLIGAAKQNILVAFCVTVATIAMVFSLILYNCCGKDQTSIKKMTGFEMCDIRVGITHAIDAESLKRTLLEMPEIRKVNLTHDFFNVSVGNKDVLSVIYEDFSQVETINTYEGRLPVYDNELAITGALAKQLGKEIGDSIEIEHKGYSMRYLISGISQSMINNGQTLYFTEQGIKQIYPSYEADLLDIYLVKGADKKAVIEKIEEDYGQSITKTRDKEDVSGQENKTYEQKLQDRAEEKIASLMALYGVDSIDYAIMIDGVLIKGNSQQFAIDQIIDQEEYVQNNIGVYMVGISWGTKVIICVASIIIVVIIIMLIKNQLVRQRMDLGIYKSLGYTGKELMLQVTLSLMPSVMVGVIGGSILAVLASPIVLSGVFSTIGVTNMLVDIRVLDIMILGVSIILFSFGAAMMSAYSIKDISPYELLIE